MLHYIYRGRQQCKGSIRPSLPHTQACSSPSLSLSFSELSVCISLLPSHLSDLTVGGSPPEPPPVSADFLLQVHASRRSGDEAIGRNRLARQVGGGMTKTRAQRSRVTGSARRSSRREEASPPPPAAEPSSPRPAVTTEAQIAAIVRQMTVLTDAVKSLQQQPAARPMPSRSSRRRPRRPLSPPSERSQQRSHGEEEGRPRCDACQSQQLSPSLLERARREKRPRTPSASLSESSRDSTPGVSQH